MTGVTVLHYLDHLSALTIQYYSYVEGTYLYDDYDDSVYALSPTKSGAHMFEHISH